MTALEDVVPEKQTEDREAMVVETPDSKVSREDSAYRLRRLLWLPLTGYLIAAMLHDARRAAAPVCIALLVAGCQLWDALHDRLGPVTKGLRCSALPSTRLVLGFIVLGKLVLVLVVAWDDWSRLIPVGGLLFLVFGTWLCSAYRQHVSWRPVITGILLQVLLSLFIMRTSFGLQLFKDFGDAVQHFLDFASKGSEFVFGDRYKDFFAFNVLPVVIFFSSVVAVLYHLGIIQAIFVRIGWLMQKVMGTSYCESLLAASNIFLGQTEAPLLAKPFLEHLTLSEIHAVMTAGFASIAGGVMAAYIAFKIPADSLIAASVMSCPAALAMSKLSYPETEMSRTNGLKIVTRDDSTGLLDAMSTGVMTGASIAATIAAMLIAFVAAMACLNAAFTWAGELVGLEGLTFDLALSYAMWPLAFLMGVPQQDCLKVGLLIGEKTVLNEFVAYRHLADFVAAGEISQKAEVIATYALCGFSNFSSVGIQIGGLSILAPTRKADFAHLALRAMVTGSVACFMTGCIAGILIEGE